LRGHYDTLYPKEINNLGSLYEILNFITTGSAGVLKTQSTKGKINIETTLPTVYGRILS